LPAGLQLHALPDGSERVMGACSHQHRERHAKGSRPGRCPGREQVCRVGGG